MYLYKVGTRSNVLNNQGVLISEISFKRGSTAVTYVCIRYLIHKHTLRHIFGTRWKCVHSYRTRLQQHSAVRSTQTDPFLSLCEEKISSILHYKHFEQRMHGSWDFWSITTQLRGWSQRKQG